MVNQAITTTSYGQDQQELILEPMNSDEDDIDGDDENAIQAYRQQRLKEFARISNPAVRRQQKVFGQVDDIDSNEYASMIDNEWKSVPIVIHLYDEVGSMSETPYSASGFM
jgi:Phosducin